LHASFIVDHLVRHRAWREHHDASCSERLRPDVAERQEHCEWDVAKVVAPWDGAVSPRQASDAPQAARG
jgi:hypothetical protein